MSAYVLGTENLSFLIASIFLNNFIGQFFFITLVLAVVEEVDDVSVLMLEVLLSNHVRHHVFEGLAVGVWLRGRSDMTLCMRVGMRVLVMRVVFVMRVRMIMVRLSYPLVGMRVLVMRVVFVMRVRMIMVRLSYRLMVIRSHPAQGYAGHGIFHVDVWIVLHEQLHHGMDLLVHDVGPLPALCHYHAVHLV